MRVNVFQDDDQKAEMTMSEQPVPGLRELAVKIATSYTRANPTSVDSLPGIIQSAYRGLLACTLPPAAPSTAKSIRGPQDGKRPGRRRRG